MKRVIVVDPKYAGWMKTSTEMAYNDVEIHKGGLLGKDPNSVRITCGDKKKARKRKSGLL